MPACPRRFMNLSAELHPYLPTLSATCVCLCLCILCICLCLCASAVTAHLSGLHSAIKMLCGKLAVIQEHMDAIAAGACLKTYYYGLRPRLLLDSNHTKAKVCAKHVCRPRLRQNC